MIMLPLLYSALYLWASWNPLVNTQTLPVALVNSDEGSELEGEEVRAGDQVVDGLHDNDQINWTEVTAQEAEDGVRDGTYYFSLELPPNFSEAVTSAAGTDAEKAQLIATYNDANGYLNTIIGENVIRKVLNTVGTTISAEAVDQVLIGVLDAGDGLSQAADGAGELADGTGELRGQMPTLLDGTGELADGLVQLKDGSEQLAAGTQELNDQVGQLAELQDGVAQLGAGVEELGAGATQIDDGVQELKTSVDQVTGLQAQSAGELRAVAADLRGIGLGATTDAADQLDRAADGLETRGVGPQSELASQLTQLTDGTSELAYQLSDPSAPSGAG